MKVVLYARVSRDDLNCENQMRILKDWAQKQGAYAQNAAYFTEEVSSRKTRPVKESIMQGLRSGEYQTVVVVRIDRWARSLQELVMDVREIVAKGCRFVSLLNGFDFAKDSFNASNQLMLNIFGAFAEFEREIIRERTLEGLARVKAQGKIQGRHPKRCGCGKEGIDGKKHNGYMKPVRNESNVLTGWKDERKQPKEQTPPVNTTPIHE